LSKAQIAFGNEKQNSLPAQCLDCRYLNLCNGECPKNRILTTKDGEPGLNYLCTGLKRYFKHVWPFMEFMAEELRNERPPANVMRSKMVRW